MSSLFLPGDLLKVQLHQGGEVKVSKQLHDARLRAVVEVIPTGAQWLGDACVPNFQDDDEVQVLCVDGHTLTCKTSPSAWSTATASEVRLKVLRHYFLPLSEEWPPVIAESAATADVQAATTDTQDPECNEWQHVEQTLDAGGNTSASEAGGDSVAAAPSDADAAAGGAVAGHTGAAPDDAEEPWWTPL